MSMRQRSWLGDDATRWIWVGYGLVQAVISTLIAFDVVDTFTAAEVTTAVALILYVAVNELLVRPRRRDSSHGSGANT